jgi:uncharacterized membrane protein YbaN (DUF454 family)
MSFDTTLDETTVGLAGSVAFSAVGPANLRIGPAARTGPGPGPGSGANAEGRLEVGDGVWIACHERSGAVEIHNPGLFRPGREAFCRALAESAIEGFRARRVEINLTSSMCRLEFRPGECDRAELARRVAGAVKAAAPSIRDRAGSTQPPRASWTILTAVAGDGGLSIRRRREDRPGRVILRDTPASAKQSPGAPKGTPRPVHLVLAGGSLTMAVAGAILPGIPALPFLLLTARHAAHLSPGIDRFLRRRPWSAALLRQVEAQGRLMRLDQRTILKMLPPLAVAAAAFVIVRPPLPVVLGLEIGVMAFACFRELGRPDGREVALGARA